MKAKSSASQNPAALVPDSRCCASEGTNPWHLLVQPGRGCAGGSGLVLLLPRELVAGLVRERCSRGRLPAPSAGGSAGGEREQQNHLPQALIFSFPLSLFIQRPGMAEGEKSLKAAFCLQWQGERLSELGEPHQSTKGRMHLPQVASLPPCSSLVS